MDEDKYKFKSRIEEEVAKDMWKHNYIYKIKFRNHSFILLFLCVVLMILWLIEVFN